MFTFEPAPTPSEAAPVDDQTKKPAEEPKEPEQPERRPSETQEKRNMTREYARKVVAELRQKAQSESDENKKAAIVAKLAEIVAADKGSVAAEQKGEKAGTDATAALASTLAAVASIEGVQIAKAEKAWWYKGSLLEAKTKEAAPAAAAPAPAAATTAPAAAAPAAAAPDAPTGNKEYDAALAKAKETDPDRVRTYLTLVGGLSKRWTELNRAKVAYYDKDKGALTALTKKIALYKKGQTLLDKLKTTYQQSQRDYYSADASIKPVLKENMDRARAKYNNAIAAFSPSGDALRAATEAASNAYQNVKLAEENLNKLEKAVYASEKQLKIPHRSDKEPNSATFTEKDPQIREAITIAMEHRRIMSSH